MGTLERNQRQVKERTTAAIDALQSEVKGWHPKGQRWPPIGDRVRLVPPHPLAGQQGIVIRLDTSLLFPADESRPVVLLTGGEKTFISQPGEWRPA